MTWTCAAGRRLGLFLTSVRTGAAAALYARGRVLDRFSLQRRVRAARLARAARR